ncbi:rubrerythrin-like domain-containing protein [Natronomonas sp. CBA1123]|jgi:ribosomal protein L37E|nr:rubrerythrin-like domain-containing protein [Natronomonas sp. CBA1123]MUV85898.1 rubrerythrin-like domain-containing protein [Natronomonas sp. CBA1123]
MRPATQKSGTELYECFDCGRRTEHAESLVCTACGGELWNLSQSRDL